MYYAYKFAKQSRDYNCNVPVWYQMSKNFLIIYYPQSHRILYSVNFLSNTIHIYIYIYYLMHHMAQEKKKKTRTLQKEVHGQNYSPEQCLLRQMYS